MLTTFVGGTRQPELARLGEREIADIVQAEHGDLLGASGPPEFMKTTRWARAIPQYELGHAARIAQLADLEHSFPGLHFCANYRGGISVGDCIKSAERAASVVAARLGGIRRVSK